VHDTNSMAKSSARTNLVCLDLSIPSEIQDCVEDAHSTARAKLERARAQDREASTSNIRRAGPGTYQFVHVNK